MRDRVFLDTNMLIYLYSEDEEDKRISAYSLINENFCVTSIQAFNEASNVWQKKYKFSERQVIKCLDEVETVCDELMLIQRKTVNHALEIKERYGFSYYDCLMLASARES